MYICIFHYYVCHERSVLEVHPFGYATKLYSIIMLIIFLNRYYDQWSVARRGLVNKSYVYKYIIK